MKAAAIRAAALGACRSLRSGHRTLASSVGIGLQKQLDAVRQALAEAVESAEAVRPSAQQLLLETDPAARGPREQYERHYSELALLQLQGALEQVGHLKEGLGSEEDADALLRRERLAVLVADAQLWRDRTAAAIAAGKRREAANEVVCDS